MVTIYSDRGGIGKDTVWPSLSSLNSSSYTAQGPGSRAWYLDAGVRREAEYVAGRWAPAPSSLGFVRNLSTTMMSQTYSNVSAAAQPAQNFCYHMTVVISGDAKRFRVPLDNASTTLPFRVKSAAIACSDAIGADVTFGATKGQPRVTPSGSWVPITWDSGSTSVEIGVATSSGVYTRKWSDWIPCPTIKNADRSNLRIVMLRFWVEGTTSSPGNGYCTGANTQAWRTLSANTSLHRGFYWQCVRSYANGVAVPADFEPNTDLSALPFLTAIMYEGYTPGMTVAFCGDSIMAGAVNGSSGNFGNGHAWNILNYLRTRYPHIPIEGANFGCPSQPSNVYSLRILEYLGDSENPAGMLIYQPWSQNDGAPSESIISAQESRLSSVQAAASLRGLGMHVVTPCPNTSFGWSAAVDGYRLGYRHSLLGRSSPLFVVIDHEVISSGATPARYATSLTTDNAHPNELGHVILGRSGSATIGPVGL